MSSESVQHIFRNLMEEPRDAYTVTYQPIDVRSPVALLSLFFAPADGRDLPAVSKAMEAEMIHWLERFPVPVKVVAFTTRKRQIKISPASPSSCHLMGYVRLADGAIVRRWGTIEEREFPDDVLAADHLERVYAEIPYRIREEDQALARADRRERWKSLSAAAGLALVFPVSLQAVLQGGQTVAVPLTVFSALIGIYKGAGVLGWRKPSRRERRKREQLFRKEHYFYHCEKNPAAFARLEETNRRREISEENKEARRFVEEVAARQLAPKPEGSRFFLPRFRRARS